MFVNFGHSPEWFLKDDDTLLPVNGTARGLCPDLPNIIQHFGAQERASAPQRGNSPQTYEGVFGKDGKYLYDDCSEYEIEVAADIRHELFSNPDEDEDEGKRTRRAARKVGLPLKVAKDIYLKTVDVCMRAMNTK
jgi:hypothetical protein